MSLCLKGFSAAQYEFFFISKRGHSFTKIKSILSLTRHPHAFNKHSDWQISLCSYLRSCRKLKSESTSIIADVVCGEKVANSFHSCSLINVMPFGQFQRLRRTCDDDVAFVCNSKEMLKRYKEQGY